MAKKDLPYYVRELKIAEDENIDSPDTYADVPRIMLASINCEDEVMKLAMGFLAILSNQNLSAIPFNIGPEYEGLDFLRAASQNPVYTLDSYYQTEDELAYLLTHYTEGHDLGLLVASNDYYNTYTPYTSAWSNNREVPEGSPADLAIKTNTPVVFVLDLENSSFSSLAKLEGLLSFRDDTQISGLILINIDRSEIDDITMMIENEFNMPVFGAIPKDYQVKQSLSLYSEIPEVAQDNWNKTMDNVISLIQENIDLMRILKLARRAHELENDFPESLFKAQKLIGFRDEGFRIAVARDEAFNDYYQENIDLLVDLGAQIQYFSPLRNPILPAGTAGVYLGSGNLLNHLAEISKNESLRKQINKLAMQGMPILAEGSGAVYLAREFETKGGNLWPLVGVLPTTVSEREQVNNYYAKFTSRRDDLLLPRNQNLKVLMSNKFNFSPNGASYRSLTRGMGHTMEGFSTKTIWASQARMHFYANPVSVARFVLACLGIDPDQRR